MHGTSDPYALALSLTSTAVHPGNPTPRMPRHGSGEVPAVARAVAVLDCLAQQRAPMSLARLASGLQLPKSSVHALCGTLLAHGYLRRQGDGSFFIGPRVMPLADAFVAGTHVATEFNALWDAAQASPEETVILSVLDGHDTVYVAARDGCRPLGLAFRVGMRLPAHLAASGKAMLAWQPVEVVRQLFPSGRLPAPLGPHRDAQTLADFEAELAEVRRSGFSVDSEGVREGVHCYGAAVFDAACVAVAGVGVCVQHAVVDPESRERHAATVRAVAARLTERLGGSFPPPRD